MRGIEISVHYRNEAYAKRYVKINCITHFLVDYNKSKDQWWVWEMTGPGNGWVITCESKENAEIKAKKMAELTGLPWGYNEPYAHESP